MDGDRFDGLIRRLSRDGIDRRDAVKTVVGGSLGLAIVRAAIDDAVAKNRKGNGKKCVKNLKACPSDPSKCCGKKCCTDVHDTDQFCAPKKSVCCPAGGACASKNPTCCEDQSGVTTGCAPAGAVCCPDGATYCPPNSTCCPDGSCCPGTDCCTTVERGGSRAESQRQRALIHGRR